MPATSDAATRWTHAAIIAIAMSNAGCYLAHEPSDGTCVSIGVGTLCDAGFTVIPEGACRMRDGRVIAFSSHGPPALASCTPSAAHPGALEVIVDCPAPHPSAILCPDAPTSGPITFVDSDGHTRSVAPALGSCALVGAAEPSEDFRAFEEATELCIEPLTYCGAPLVIELVQRDGDGCYGRAYVQRCDVEVEGSRIVLDAQSAPGAPTICPATPADRVARCVVPPLPPGTYDVALADGRVLDSVEVASRPNYDGERRCTPIP